MSKPKLPANLIKLEKLDFPRQPEYQSLSKKYELSRSTSVVDSENNRKFKIEYNQLREVRLLGAGQFGVVYEMYHEQSNLTFAVKRIDENNLNDSDGSNTNDIMDLLVPLKVGHYEYLVRYYGALHADGSYWILTELMDTTLDSFYHKCFETNLHISELFLSKVVYAVLSALHFMKSKGYMHRDIKPSNILINSTGEIKVCDFGISGKTENSISKTIGKGCRPYMPPEKINEELSKHGYTIKSDVWSLGISLVEIATGVHPYEKMNYFEQTKAIVEGPAPSVDPTMFSDMLCDFLGHCLRKKEHERLKPIELLGHAFVKRYESRGNDMELIRKTIELIRQDNATR